MFSLLSPSCYLKFPNIYDGERGNVASLGQFAESPLPPPPVILALPWANVKHLSVVKSQESGFSYHSVLKGML